MKSYIKWLGFYLKNKSTDCILYSNDGSKFRVHKEMLGQTDFLREILSSTKEHCFGTVEVLCSCSKEELKHLVNFLYDGEIHCENESDSLKIIENLQKIFGFPKNLDLDLDPDETFSNTVNIIESEEVFEDILDDVSGELIASNQDKEDNVLENGEKEVSEKKKKSKKISRNSHFSSIEKNANKFNCNDCGASFIQKSRLQRHINEVHLKIKPCECDLCAMSFSQKVTLKGHVKVIHQQLRPFKCDLCEMSFAGKDNLKRHVKEIHQQIRLFECDKLESSVLTFDFNPSKA